MPFVTIDPKDARDHDDACYAKPDDDPKNIGGHLIWVAIADVAHFVRSGDAIDKEARHRGNSTYFPDRVVPMLPDNLSGNLCSLHEGEKRACIVVKIKIDNKEFNLECGKGEEGLLRKAEKQLNLKLQDHGELSTLPEAKKYLMMALIIAGENIDKYEKEKKIDLIFGEIDEELSKLENQLIERSKNND